MKKIIMFAALAILAMAAVAWAGERSRLLSEKELTAIESIAKKAYPRGSQINMVVDEDLFGRFTVIEFIKEDHTVSLWLEVYPHFAVMRGAESAKIGERVGVKLIEEIEKILNKSPRLALGNILD